MTEYKYRAEITHTDKTVGELYKTQYYLYDKTRVITRFLIGFALIITAIVFALPLAVKGILLLLGAWLVSTPDFPSQIRAERNLSARKTALPVLSYEFFDDKMKIYGEGSGDIAYDKIQFLIFDKNYFYLFLSKNSACMIDKNTISENTAEFMNFIEEKTKKKWRVQKSFLAMNLQDLKNLNF